VVPRKVTDEEVLDIPGWFPALDVAVFRFFLAEQARRGYTGDLAELGAYLGASAVLIGSYLGPDEVFTVVDLFEDAPAEHANATEHARWYGGLSQLAFESNYRRLHNDVPVVIRGPSTAIRGRARDRQHRFVHVDASHVYRHVRDDVETARRLSAVGGVVVFDDFRAEHAPGVAAAVWPALATGLIPLALTPSKLYGAWEDASWWPAAIAGWLPTSGFAWENHDVAGFEVARIWRPPGPGVRWLPPALLPLAARWRRRGRRMLGRS
jgi:hypothetical protein